MSETLAKKRQTLVHFDDKSNDSVQVLDTKPMGQKVTPSAATRSTVVDAMVSHPEPIWELLLAMSGKFTTLHVKLRQQEQTLLSLSEDSFIPHSARTHFTLNASNSIMETDTYMMLAKDMEAVCNTFHKAAKNAISTVAKLEIENTKKQIAKVFTSTAKHTAHLVILKHNAVLQNTNVKLATLAIKKLGSSLTKYSCLKHLDKLNAISHPAVYSG